ncbi:BMP family ABC transporter substrate-binding protein [Anaerofilum sp. BX8]|uniref:BMP family ABC transporter substrate-binding protein n=1 Tax=Anaerofilum hominis TaxID=2763016 RepID=A0A923L217_9FIRM|nr:BMP family ABC transporter substrate-binding protein [Anaerofilum hominis]MBC5582401.1 BMP family ABC transporter substrate-binding protein [Anaerofilum hominis]
MKKLVALFLAAALTLSLVACGGGGSSSAAPAGSGSTAGSSAAASTPKEPLNVALLYGGTLGAQAFIDVVDKGFKQAAADFGINYSVLENVELSAAADTFRTVIANGADVLVVADVKWNEALAEVADENPDFPFVHLDADGTGGLSSAHPNIYEVSYKEHESAFLNGVFCALMSKTGKVAQIQGSDSGTMIRFNSGFRAGVQYVLDTDPPTTVVGFSDVNKGYETAMLYYDQGYDWLAACAAGSNLGVFQASQEKGGDNWCCGAADGQFHLMPERIVCSQVKTIDKVGYNYIKHIVETGDFKGGQWDVLGIAEGGVDLIFNDQNEELLKIIPEETMAKYEAIRDEVVSGAIQVPATYEELDAFTARYEG